MRPFAVYYGTKDLQSLSYFSTLVLDADSHPDLARIRAKAPEKQIILGYLSLGEVGAERPYASRLRSAGLLAGENPNWPGSSYIDVRGGVWRDMVVKELVPAIQAAGFDGLFLDTLDDPPFLEEKDAQKFAGISEGAIALVHAIRTAFPSLPVMMNRGLQILPKLGCDVNFVLGESMLTTYDSSKKTYRFLKPATRRPLVEQLHQAQRSCPSLKVFTLDYWPPNDMAGIRQIYRQQVKAGFVPYVATPELDQIGPVP